MHKMEDGTKSTTLACRLVPQKIGKPHFHWLTTFRQQDLDIAGKKVAVFGLGDSVSYSENYADGCG